MRRSVMAVAAAAPLPPLSSPPPPLPVMPIFTPKPFAQEKFLSIKSRSAESFIESRRELLARSATLRRRIAALSTPASSSSPSPSSALGQSTGERGAQHDHATPLEKGRDASRTYGGGEVDASSAARVDQVWRGPLPPALVEELAGLHDKLERLESMQGFVLTDELVYRAFHDCVQGGGRDYSTALQRWLLPRILLEERGPVYPLFILEDLVTMAEDYLLRVLPDGQASVVLRSSFPPPPPLSLPLLSGSGTANTATMPAARHQQRQLSWAQALLSGQAVSSTSTAAAAADAAVVTDPLPLPLKVKKEYMESLLTAFPTPSQQVAGTMAPPSLLRHRELSRYARYQLDQFALPLLVAVDAFGLLFSTAEPRALEEEEEEEEQEEENDQIDREKSAGEAADVRRSDGSNCAAERNSARDLREVGGLWIPRAEVQRAAAVSLFASFTTHHSFLDLSPPNSSVSPPSSVTAAIDAEAPISLSAFDLKGEQRTKSGRETLDGGTVEREAERKNINVEGCDGVDQTSNLHSDEMLTLRLVMQLYLSLAQCAAEARSDTLLLVLLSAFIRGFVTQRADGTYCLCTDHWVSAFTARSRSSSATMNAVDAVSPSPSVEKMDGKGSGRAEEEADAEAAAITACLRQFAVDFLAIVFYGRQALLSDRSIWQTHDMLCVIGALNTILSSLSPARQQREKVNREGDEVGTRADHDDKMDVNSTREQSEVLRSLATEERVLASIQALMSSPSAHTTSSSTATSTESAEAVCDKTISEGLPRAVRGVLLSLCQRQKTADSAPLSPPTTVSDSLWREAATIAADVLRCVVTSSGAGGGDVMEAVAHSARLYVAVADGDVETLEALRQHLKNGEASSAEVASGDQKTPTRGTQSAAHFPFSDAELSALVASGVAARSARREGQQLLAMLSSAKGGESAVGVSASVERTASCAVALSEAFASALVQQAGNSAAAGAATETARKRKILSAQRQTADCLLELATTNTLTRTLKCLRGCYAASVTTPRPHSHSAPSPSSPAAFSNAEHALDGSDDGDGLRADAEHADGEDADDVGDKALHPQAVANDAGAHHDDWDGPPVTEGDEEDALSSDHSAGEGNIENGAAAADAGRFAELFLSEYPSLLRAVGQDIDVLQRSCGSLLTPVSAARFALLHSAFLSHGDMAEDAVSASSSVSAFYAPLTDSLIKQVREGNNNADEEEEGEEGGDTETGFFGNAMGLFLLCLARAGCWPLVEQLLTTVFLPTPPSASSFSSPSITVAPGSRTQSSAEGKYEPPHALAGPRPLLSSVTVEPEVFAEVFQRARDDGASGVCLLLRQNRERLFF